MHLMHPCSQDSQPPKVKRPAEGGSSQGQEQANKLKRPEGSMSIR